MFAFHRLPSAQSGFMFFFDQRLPKWPCECIYIGISNRRSPCLCCKEKSLIPLILNVVETKVADDWLERILLVYFSIKILMIIKTVIGLTDFFLRLGVCPADRGYTFT